jgi:phosphoglycolate phosphatase
MTTPHSVFFDLDGTLTDPWLGISRCIRHALDTLDVNYDPDDDFRWCIGPPLRNSLGMLAGNARSEHALSIYRERYSEIGWRENAPYDGIHDALDTLRRNGHTMYVATSKPHVYAARILEHFELLPFFDGIYGADFDGTRSDKSALLAHALSQKSAMDALRDPVMVGDRRYDVIGARANGMRTVGVSYGYGSVEELAEAGVGRIVDHPSELPGAL